MSKHGFMAMLAGLMLACQLARGAGLQPSQTTPTTSATTVFFSVQNTTLPNGTDVGRYANGTIDYITSTTEEWVPVGMASDAAGNIVFGLNDGHGNVSLKEYTIDGKLVDLGPLFRQMGWGYWAFDLRFNPQGELCFSHYNGKDIGNGISKITADGRIEPVLQTTDIPEGFAFDRQGNLYYGVLDGSSDSFRFRLKKLSTDGVITDYGLVAWCSYTTTRWSFDLAVSPAGEVYFNHWGDSTRGTGISKLKTDGAIVSVIHADNAPVGVSFDARGTFFFCTFNLMPAINTTYSG